jgi:four helix bundle protein
VHGTSRFYRSWQITRIWIIDFRLWNSANGSRRSHSEICAFGNRHMSFRWSFTNYTMTCRSTSNGLRSQMCRATVSVCSNIAEGFGRRSLKEKDRFYSIANGLLTGLENQLLIAHGVSYIDKAKFATAYEKCETTHRTLVVLQKVNFKKGERS